MLSSINSINTFTANSKFDEKLKENPQIRTSSFFRFGSGCSTQAHDYGYIIDTIKLALLRQKKPEILFVGVGEGAQELYSAVAVLRDIRKDKPLKKLAKVTCVDIQPQYSEQKLNSLGYLDAKSWVEYDCDANMRIEPELVPRYAKSSFEKVNDPNSNGRVAYKVEKSADDFCKEVLKKRTFWETDFVEFSKKSKKKFDLIFMQNVYYYLNSDEKQIVRENLPRLLKNQQFLISKDLYQNVPGLFQLERGIYVKSKARKKGLKGTLQDIRSLLYRAKVNLNMQLMPKHIVEELNKFSRIRF